MLPFCCSANKEVMMSADGWHHTPIYLSSTHLFMSCLFFFPPSLHSRVCTPACLYPRLPHSLVAQRVAVSLSVLGDKLANIKGAVM